MLHNLKNCLDISLEGLRKTFRMTEIRAEILSQIRKGIATPSMFRNTFKIKE
jgi:hypothetical protein